MRGIWKSLDIEDRILQAFLMDGSNRVLEDQNADRDTNSKDCGGFSGNRISGSVLEASHAALLERTYLPVSVL